MLLFRATNPDVFDYVAELFIDDPTVPRSVVVQELKDFISVLPQNMHVQILAEDERVRGFSIAYHVDHRPYVFLVQAWIDPRLGNTDWSFRMFQELKEFTLAAKKVEIRAETQREPALFYRRWGFRPLSTVLSYRIGEAKDVDE